MIKKNCAKPFGFGQSTILIKRKVLNETKIFLLQAVNDHFDLGLDNHSFFCTSFLRFSFWKIFVLSNIYTLQCYKKLLFKNLRFKFYLTRMIKFVFEFLINFLSTKCFIYVLAASPLSSRGFANITLIFFIQKYL